jgi:hypothetical protein
MMITFGIQAVQDNSGMSSRHAIIKQQEAASKDRELLSTK